FTVGLGWGGRVTAWGFACPISWFFAVNVMRVYPEESTLLGMRPLSEAPVTMKDGIIVGNNHGQQGCRTQLWSARRRAERRPKALQISGHDYAVRKQGVWHARNELPVAVRRQQ